MLTRRWPLIGMALVLAGCGLTSRPASAGTAARLEVVAAENFWGSIVSQLGGARVHVTSIVVNPDTDPHSYEARPEDARNIAQAHYVVLNGAGYDPWVSKLLDANSAAGRRVLTVADLLGRKAGDNPHFWYSPDYLNRVIDRVSADLKALAPADAAYFDQQRAAYLASGLRDYRDLIQAIRQKHVGTPVGATESIFTYLAGSLGLTLITPPEYMKAISEGTDPSAADKISTTGQVALREIRVLVYNSQNTTPDVNALVDRARAERIAVTAVTETLSPATATFQDWQTAQLRALQRALGG
jgi:zinc/manganese transport system substrate-binding protein